MQGDAPVQTSDLLIPKILLMQGQSKLVKDEKAKQGEIRDSLSGDLLGARDKAGEIIAFHSYKTWLIFHKKDGVEKYVEQVPWTPENDKWAREEVAGGVTIKRVRSLNFYVLIPSEVESGVFFPKVIAFRSTSYTAGRKLETERAKLQMFGKPLALRVFNVTSVRAENEKGSFYVFDAAAGRQSSDKELEAAAMWKDLIRNSTSVRVDESDIVEAEAAAVSDIEFATNEF
jgi:hypothetical protein